MQYLRALPEGREAALVGAKAQHGTSMAVQMCTCQNCYRVAAAAAVAAAVTWSRRTTAVCYHLRH